MEDDLRSERSTRRTNKSVEHVKAKVRSNRCLTVRMLADELSMNSESVWTIIMKDMGMRKICAKMVPRLLNHQLKERHGKCVKF